MFEIAEEQLLVREGLVELELVYDPSVQAGVYEALVLHALLVLLPLQVDESRGAVL